MNHRELFSLLDDLLDALEEYAWNRKSYQVAGVRRRISTLLNELKCNDEENKV